MRKVIKIALIMMFSFFVISIFSNVKAATASISANKTNVKVGEKVTITVTMNAAAWNTKITGAQTKNFAGNSDSGENITKNEQVTFTPTSAGSFTINLSGDVSDGTTMQTTNVSGSVTIKATESETNNNNNNNNSNNNNDNKPETPSEPTFKSANETVYATGDINVRKSYSADSEKIGSLKTGESVTRTGIGDNGWSKVTYNGSTGYIKTSLLSTEEPAKSSDKALKALEITPEGLDPEFDPETTSYTLTVGPDVEKLDIKAAPNDEKATVEITGNESLQPGDNMVKIVVTAQDGTTRTYNIDVKKQETNALGLTSIKIAGYTLSPKFSSDVYEYKINVLDPNVTKLDISAVANDENATVEISGNVNNLQSGENTIVITVTSEDGKEKVTYQIYVNKDAMAGTTNNNKTILYAGIGVAALIVIIIIIVVIAKHRKKKLENEDNDLDDYSDLYGYSSKNQKVIEDESVKTSTNSEEEIEKNIANENVTNENNTETLKSIDDIIKNEGNKNEPVNPYISRDMYGDFNNNEDNKTSPYKDLYKNLYGTGEEYKAENNNNTSMIENKKESNFDDDYTIDDNYKFRRSKGKHSK